MLSHKISKIFQANLSTSIFLNWNYISGVYSGAETHVPFPNTVVKGSSGDGTVNLTMGE